MVLSVTPQTKISVKDGKVTVLREQDAQPIVDMAKTIRQGPTKGFGNNYRFKGSIPNVMLDRMIQESFGLDYVRMKASERMAALRQLIGRRMKDPDYKDLTGG